MQVRLRATAARPGACSPQHGTGDLAVSRGGNEFRKWALVLPTRSVSPLTELAQRALHRFAHRRLAQAHRLQRLALVDAIRQCVANLRDESPLILRVSESSRGELGRA